MIDHKQCKYCIYANWTYGKGYRPKFNWCNHLDMTGETHIVRNGVCLSNSALLDEQRKHDAIERAKAKAKEDFERMGNK